MRIVVFLSNCETVIDIDNRHRSFLMCLSNQNTLKDISVKTLVFMSKIVKIW